MCASAEVLSKMRDRMLVGAALVKQLAVIAADAPPDLATRIEEIASACMTSVESNLGSVESLLSNSSNLSL